MKGLFVTGTDTEVGKTFVAAGIAAALRRRGIDIGVMKPIHTGCKIRRGRLIPVDAIRLIRSAGVDDPIELVTPYAFKEPVAPYVAALRNGMNIDVNNILKSYRNLYSKHDYTIVEGIGGILVPITKSFYVADLIKRLKLPALIVTKPGLGTINHTLLTVSCLKVKKIPIIGIVVNYRNQGKDILAEKTAPETLEELSGVSVLGTIPHLSEKISERKGAGLHPFLKLSDRLFDILR